MPNVDLEFFEDEYQSKLSFLEEKGLKNSFIDLENGSMKDMEQCCSKIDNEIFPDNIDNIFLIQRFGSSHIQEKMLIFPATGEMSRKNNSKKIHRYLKPEIISDVLEKNQNDQTVDYHTTPLTSNDFERGPNMDNKNAFPSHEAPSPNSEQGIIKDSESTTFTSKNEIKNF